MDVKSVGTYNPYTSATKKAERQDDSQNGRHMHQTKTAAEPGAIAQISDEAKILHTENNFILREYNEDSPLKFSEETLEIFKMSREERKEALDKLLPSREKPSLDPYIQYIFPEGSLGSFLTEKLEGKVDNPSYAARELTNMIYGGQEANPNATLEERAISREAGLKLAEYISQNYFDNPEEGKAFLNTVKNYAEKNILMEKGYVVFENTDMKPFKPYTMPGAPDDYTTGVFKAYAEKYYGITNAQELAANSSTIMKAYMNDMQRNPQKINALRDEIVENFAKNEKTVQNAVTKAKAAFNEVGFGANFMDDLNNVLGGLNQSNTAKLAEDILKLFS